MTVRIPDPAHPEAAPAKTKAGVPAPLNPVHAKTMRGMLLYTPVPGIPRRFKFQYNPESLSISHTSKLYQSEDGSQPQAAPSLSLSVTIVLEATRMGTTQRNLLGIRPQISALETLVYPSLVNVALNAALMAGGMIEAVPALPPICLFFYGKRPPIPVRLTGVSVDEKLHDGQLNPIHAEATVSMEGYSYSDVPPDNPNFALSVAHQTLLQGYTTAYYLLP